MQLGQVNAVMRESEGAIALWQEAQVIYRELGESEQVDLLESYIQEEREFLP
jgi:hypothetical protein